MSAKDLHIGNIKEITITDSVCLSEEEIAAKIHEAEERAAEDAQKR